MTNYILESELEKKYPGVVLAMYKYIRNVFGIGQYKWRKNFEYVNTYTRTTDSYRKYEVSFTNRHDLSVNIIIQVKYATDSNAPLITMAMA